MKRFSLLGILALVSFSDMPSAQPAPKVINFVTGVPLRMASASQGGSGFGDVAANIHSALVYKKHFPDATVNVIVTSIWNPTTPGLTTSAEIAKTMIPILRPGLKNTPQRAYGVNFIFLSADARKLIRPELVTELDLSPIPPSDLSIQFSANDSPMESVVRFQTKVAIIFNEFSESGPETVLLAAGRGEFGALLRMNSGPNSAGVYLDSKFTEMESKSHVLANWFSRQRGVALADADRLAFAYSMRAASTQIYLDALKKIAALDPSVRYLVVTKDFQGLDVSGAPPNLVHVPVRTHSHSIFQALIRSAVEAILVYRYF